MTDRLDDHPRTVSRSAPVCGATVASSNTGDHYPERRLDLHAVEVTTLIRDFGSPRAPIRAVDNLDLTVNTGEIYGFLGPNGAGKTTLVRILTTLLRPTSGSALVAGYDVVRQADDVRRSIGVALQEAAIDASARPRCSTASGSPRRATGASAATRAACGGGSTSRWPSSIARPSSSSTSPPRASTRRAARRCGARCGA